VVALKKNALTLLGSFVAAGLIVVATSRTTLATSREEGSFRDCPRCLSPVPLKASRCAHCTSDLQPAAAR